MNYVLIIRNNGVFVAAVGPVTVESVTPIANKVQSEGKQIEFYPLTDAALF